MKNVLLKFFSVAMVAGVLVLASCSKNNDNPLSTTDVQNVNTESVTSAQANEVADVANTVMSNVSDAQLSATREAWADTVIGKDGRLKGATIIISGTKGANGPMGTITINYGSPGIKGPDGVTRSGMINIAYTGKRFMPGSTRAITFSNFKRNAVGISGTIGILVASADSVAGNNWIVTHNHTSQLTFTFADNTTATRSATYTAVWNIFIGAPTQSSVTHNAGGSATGTTRKGASYTMNITADIKFLGSCAATGYYFPQSGSKTLTVTPAGSSTQNVYTFTFGNGTSSSCTNTVTIQFNGKTKTITISPDGN
ncbi:MAG: hypothetical protein JST69_02775 [Bacteroidetes bacterium]|nr:hypothetical protein [Bacteroidota bacterium]